MEEPGYPAEELELKRRLMGYSPEDVQKLLADREQMLAMASESTKSAEARIADLERELEAVRDEMPRPEDVEDRERTLAEIRAQLGDARDDWARSQDELTRSQAELEQVRSGLADEERNRQTAEERANQYAAELDELRQDLLSARRDLINENERARIAESRIEELTSALEGSLASSDTAVPAISDPSTADEVANVLRAAEEVVSRVMEGGRARAQQELEEIHRELEEAQRARDEVRLEIDRLRQWRDRLAPQVEVVRSSIEDAQLHAMRFGERIQEAVHPITAAMHVLGEQLEELTEVGAMGPQGSPEGAAPAGPEASSAEDAPTTQASTGPGTAAPAGPEPQGDGAPPTTGAPTNAWSTQGTDPGGSPGRPLTEVPSS